MVYKGIIKIETNSRIRLYKSRIRWKRRRAEGMEHGGMGQSAGGMEHGAWRI
jgi:hypothetical protein